MVLEKRERVLMRHKFNAKPVYTEDMGFFPSTLHYRYHMQLLLRVKSGEVLFYLREVPLDIVYDTEKKVWVKFRIDYLEFLSKGICVFTEVKGCETEVYKIKKVLVEEKYNIKINVVKKV